MHTYARLLLLGLALPACTPDSNPSEVGDTDQAGGDDGTTDGTNDPNEDADGDGVPSADDCDDSDTSLGARAEDADCDGTLTADDCNDFAPWSTPALRRWAWPSSKISPVMGVAAASR